jgi:hypothetical protein
MVLKETMIGTNSSANKEKFRLLYSANTESCQNGVTGTVEARIVPHKANHEARACCLYHARVERHICKASDTCNAIQHRGNNSPRSTMTDRVRPLRLRIERVNGPRDMVASGACMGTNKEFT